VRKEEVNSCCRVSLISSSYSSLRNSAPSFGKHSCQKRSRKTKTKKEKTTKLKKERKNHQYLLNPKFQFRSAYRPKNIHEKNKNKKTKEKAKNPHHCRHAYRIFASQIIVCVCVCVLALLNAFT